MGAVLAGILESLPHTIPDAAIPAQLKKADEALRKSEEHYRRLIETAGEGVWVLDAQHITTFVNRTLLSMLGYEESEMVGRPVTDFLDDPNRIVVTAQLVGRRQGAKGNYEVACRRKDGSLMYALIAASAIVGDQRQYEGSLGMITDITERKEAEQALRQQERQLAEAQRIAHIGSWHWELQSNQIQWSDEHYRICGLPPQKSPVPSETAIACIHPEDREMVLGHCTEAMQGTGQYQCELRIVRPDGTQRFAHSRGEVIRDASGRPIEMFGTLQDITESKVAQDRLTESELRFRQLAENIREVFWMSDPHKSEILYVSPGYAKTWGRSPDDLRANRMAFTESIHPDDRARVVEWVKDQPTVDSSEIEYRIIRPDGSMRWIRDRSFAVKDADGNVIRNAGIAEDITERKNAENATTRLAAIVHSSEDAIISETLDGVITSWNNAAERLFGFTADEAIGKNVRMLIRAERTEEMLQAVQRVTRGERLEQFEATRICKDGSNIDVSISLSPIQDTAGKIVGISKIAHDITVRRRAEALERERAGLKESVNAMEQVLGVVGHELRTPLAALRAMSEFLLTDGAMATAEFDQFLGGINEEVIRMTETVDNLLEAARLNSGKAKWNFHRLRVRDICEQALDVIRPLVDPAAIMLGLDVPQDLQLCGDADALRRLITNLAGNSRKHTKAGRIAVSAAGRCDDNGRWIELRISDTGSGIAPEILRRLGEAFALNSGVVGANHVSGTGLGIAICNAIVAAHGGNLKVESKVGEGTVITANLRADLTKPDLLPLLPSSPPGIPIATTVT
jgi:PAS domain S-box-containing protein